MVSHIDRILECLGYAGSDSLYYKRDGFSIASLSLHNNRVLEEIAPYATYIVNNAPFILFCEEETDPMAQKLLFKRIWNAQIPIAIVCGSGQIKIYNGCAIDKRESVLNEIDSIPVDKLDASSPFSYWTITNRDLWMNYIDRIDEKRLNDHLLENLSDITNKLKETYNIPFATKLILRLIFIRYLIDRGVDIDYKGFSSDVETSRAALLHLMGNKGNLYNLFIYLKQKFNGNLFEVGDEIENENLTQDVLDLLSDFLSANIETKTGQRSFFDLYDFNIIPVELISNIYEILLGEEQRKKDNAFYTPQYLADYILNSSIYPFMQEKGTCTVLDPSCGSGIFLVESYRKMIEIALSGKAYTDDDELLRGILSQNIYGIDRNPAAIDVTIFSLYLAMLDYKNPRTLSHFELPPLKETNLFVADFFDEEALNPLKKVSFDFIVGNPPWGKGEQLLLDYCKRRDYSQYLQNSDTCRAFILRAGDFSTEKTQCTFVLHSKMLYMQGSQSIRFRSHFLRNTKIIRVIELSSVRTLVFKNANAPAVVITYKYDNNDALKNSFEYISMKPSIFFKLFNIIVIEKNDVKYVTQQLIKEYDWAWKTLVYGFAGDIDNILRLKAECCTLKEAISAQTPKIISGTGVQYNDGEQKDAHKLKGRTILEAEAIDHFSVDNRKASSFEKEKIHRTRDERLFEAPYCLVRRGLDMNNYTMRAAYLEENYVFKEALYAIKGAYEQKAFLLNVAGLLNSSAYAYFNLLLDSSLGIEREQRQTKEVLQFPYVFNPEVAQLVEKAQALGNEYVIQDVQPDASEVTEQINNKILSSFGLAGNEFVDYALHVQIPLLTESNANAAYRAATTRDFEAYAKCFYSYLSEVFSETGKHICAIVYPKIAQHYSAFEIAIQETAPNDWLQFKLDSNSNKALLTIFSEHRINEMFYRIMDTLYFSERSFCIIKPNYYKNWHPAIAKLDLSEVVEQILFRNEREI